LSQLTSPCCVHIYIHAQVWTDEQEKQGARKYNRGSAKAKVQNLRFTRARKRKHKSFPPGSVKARRPKKANTQLAK
jgi:hypothetical protein